MNTLASFTVGSLLLAPLLVSVALIPYVAGRPLLTAGLVGTWMLASRLAPDSWATRALLLVLGVVASLAVQWAGMELRTFLDRLSALAKASLRPVDAIVMPVLSMGFAVMLTAGLEKEFTVSPFEHAGIELKDVAIVGIGVLTWVFLWVRGLVADQLAIFDLGGAVGRFVQLADCLMTVVGIGAAFAFPRVAALLTLLSLTAMGGLLLWLRSVVRGARVPCGGCQAMVHGGASVCRSCGVERVPARLWWFGAARQQRVSPDALRSHRCALLAHGRCPRCAEAVGGCDHVHDIEPNELTRFIDKRAAFIVPLCGAIALVPVLGLGVALLGFRLSVASGFHAYVSWRGRMVSSLLRWAMLVALLFVQPIPGIGAICLTLALAADYVIARRVFLSRDTAPAVSKSG